MRYPRVVVHCSVPASSLFRAVLPCSDVLAMVQAGLHALAFLVTSVGFLRYGLSVKSVVINVPFNVEVRRSKLQEVRVCNHEFSGRE